MMHLVHVRLCRAATKSGDKDWYKKIDEKVIEDCMQLGACCPVNWSAREEEEAANGRDMRVTAACSPFVGNTLDTQRVRKGVGPVARGMVQGSGFRV